MLCPVNVLELLPDYAYDNYLNDTKITDDLKKVNSVEIIKTHSHTGFDWNRDYMPVMKNAAIVGTMRKHQMEKILANGKNSYFYFYFYRKTGNALLLVQTMLPCCEKLIACNDEVNFMIHADVIRPRNESHIKIMTKSALDKLLEENGFARTNPQSRADEYYVIRMKTASFEKIEGLDEKIKECEENADLSEFSPKVIFMD
jgi:hypothetical protein